LATDSTKSALKFGYLIFRQRHVFGIF